MDLTLSTMSLTLLSMQLSPETVAQLNSVFIFECIRLNFSDEAYIVNRVLVGHCQFKFGCSAVLKSEREHPVSCSYLSLLLLIPAFSL